jgi:hypothetical protein
MITRNRVAFRELQIHIGGEKDDCSRSSSGNNNGDSNRKDPGDQPAQGEIRRTRGEQEAKEGLYLKKMRIMVIGNRCTILSGECS